MKITAATNVQVIANPAQVTLEYRFCDDPIDGGLIYHSAQMLGDKSGLIEKVDDAGHNEALDNTVRVIHPDGTFTIYEANGNYYRAPSTNFIETSRNPDNPVGAYNNIPQWLIPGSAFADGCDRYVWPTFGVYKLGLSGSPTRVADSLWTHRRAEIFTSHTGTAQGGSLTSIILSSAASAIDDFYNSGIATGNVYIRSGPGVNQFAPITNYVGATRTVSIANWVVPGGGPPATPPQAGVSTYEVLAWTPDSWPGPFIEDFLRDDSGIGRTYNPFLGWWPTGEKWVMIAGGAGSNTPRMLSSFIEKNPNFPTQPQPWRIQTFQMLDQNGVAIPATDAINPAGWRWRITCRDAGKVVGDYFYMIGGTLTPRSEHYVQQRVFHRLNLNTLRLEQLAGLPAKMSFFPILSHDSKRHRLVWICYEIMCYDLDNPQNGWLDITPKIWDPATKPVPESDGFHRINGSSGNYFATADWHVFRGYEEATTPPFGSQLFRRRYWNRLRLPTSGNDPFGNSWVRE